MNELIPVTANESGQQVISGRVLHEFLEVNTRYNDWFMRMAEYGFIENTDFVAITQKRVTAQGNKTEYTDHALTIPCAKEISMLQRSEKGKQARQYFIQVEAAWNEPAAVMARALQLANQTLEAQREQMSRLQLKNEEMKPKADYFNALVDGNLLTTLRDTAKELKIKEKTFIRFLIKSGYLYRDGNEKLMPYANKNSGLFEVKERINNKNGWSGVQTLVTPRGRETFMLLLKSKNYLEG